MLDKPYFVCKHFMSFLNDSSAFSCNIYNQTINHRDSEKILAVMEKWEARYQLALQHKRQDWIGTDLRGTDLENADLENATLSYANLTLANLRGADLCGANLFHAKLSGADLRDTNLCYANLALAQLSGADLKGADLRGADLVCAILCDVKISKTTALDPKWHLVWELVNQAATGRELCGVDLSHTNLCGADLRGANLKGANLCGADLSAANLEGANLEDADLWCTLMPSQQAFRGDCV